MEIRDINGNTELMKAVMRRDLDKVIELVENGADVNARNNFMLTPYLYAGANGFPEILEYLIENGARLTDVNLFGGTSLIPSAEKGFVKNVEIALKAGVDPNIKNKLGWTALLEAVILGNGNRAYTDIIEMLLKYNSIIEIEDIQGRNAYQIAKQNNQKKVVELFEKRSRNLAENVIKARKLAENKEYLNAIELLTGNSKDEYYYKIMYLSILKEYDKVQEVFDKFYEIYPDDTEFYFYRANIYIDMGEKEKALLEMDKGIEKDDNLHFYMYHKSNFLRSQGKHEEAVEVMTKLLELDNFRYDYSFHLANSLRELKMYEKSIKAVENAIKLDPTNPCYHLHKARTLILLKEYEKAILELNYDDAECQYYLAFCYFKLSEQKLNNAKNLDLTLIKSIDKNNLLDKVGKE